LDDGIGDAGFLQCFHCIQANVECAGGGLNLFNHHAVAQAEFVHLDDRVVGQFLLCGNCSCEKATMTRHTMQNTDTTFFITVLLLVD